MKKLELTENERVTLLRMATGQRLQTIPYYVNALAKEEQGRLSWNWAAALLGPYWALYHRLFSPFWLGLLLIPLWNNCWLFLIGGKALIAASSIETEKLSREFFAGNWSVPLLLFSLLLLNTLFWAVLWGFGGNKLLFKLLRRKEKAGYCALPSYRATERGWMFWAAALILISSTCANIALQEGENLLKPLDLLLLWENLPASLDSPRAALALRSLSSGLIAALTYGVAIGLFLTKTIITPLREWSIIRRQHKENAFTEALEHFRSNETSTPEDPIQTPKGSSSEEKENG